MSFDTIDSWLPCGSPLVYGTPGVGITSSDFDPRSCTAFLSKHSIFYAYIATTSMNERPVLHRRRLPVRTGPRGPKFSVFPHLDTVFSEDMEPPILPMAGLVLRLGLFVHSRRREPVPSPFEGRQLATITCLSSPRSQKTLASFLVPLKINLYPLGCPLLSLGGGTCLAT